MPAGLNRPWTGMVESGAGAADGYFIVTTTLPLARPELT